MRYKVRVFVCVLFLAVFFSGVNAQESGSPLDLKKTISMDFQDAALKDILKILSIQSGLNFVASEAVQERKLTLYLDKVSIKEAMDKIFKANNLTYELDPKENIFLVQDWGRPESEKITKVYYLKYRSVSNANIEKEKNNLMNSGSGGQTPAAGGASSSGAYPAAAGATPAAGAAPGAPEGEGSAANLINSIRQVLSPEGKIAEDNSTNSLVVTDIPKSFKMIDHIISCLDIPQPQIMLDVEILDVAKNITDTLGFDWTGFSGNSLTYNKLVAEHYTSTLPFTSITGVLSLLRTDKDTRYLARPRLLTLNNETAEISISSDDVVGYNETTTVTTTGPVTTREYIRATDLKLTKEGIGVFLRVTPQLNSDTKEITMIVNPKSSVTKASELSGATGQADAELRATKSIVKVKDGETIVIGGLIHKDSIVNTTKVPFLSSIPIVGALFRSKDKTKDIDRELLIFITPRILKGANIEVVQADKIIFTGKAKEMIPAVNRQALINDYLNSIDKKVK